MAWSGPVNADVEVFRAAVRAALDKAAAGIEVSDRVSWNPHYRAGWVDALRAVRDDLTFTDPDPLRAKGTDDEPLDFGLQELTRGVYPPETADRRGWALALLILIVAVVAIVWCR